MRIMHATIAVTAEVGSRELVWAALAGSERAGSLQGAYVDRCEVREPSDFVLSERGRIAQDRTFVRSLFLAGHFISDIYLSARNRSDRPGNRAESRRDRQGILAGYLDTGILEQFLINV